MAEEIRRSFGVCCKVPTLPYDNARDGCRPVPRHLVIRLHELRRIKNHHICLIDIFSTLTTKHHRDSLPLGYIYRMNRLFGAKNTAPKPTLTGAIANVCFQVIAFGALHADQPRLMAGSKP